MVVDQFVVLLQNVLSQASYGRPVPVIGWLGVVAVAAYLAWAFGNWKVALLTAGGLGFVGLQGLWQESMDTLALTIAAVLLSLLVAIPLGIWAGLSNRAFRVATLVLDLMQTLPTFVYLAPLTLFFAIGPAAATIATLIYAAPPAVRLTAHAIRSVPPESVEAARSLGSTRGQTLTKVLLPMSRSTVVVGINQTIMAALSMVTVAALIDAPGLGPDGAEGPADAGRRGRVQRRSGDRRDRDRARPRHDRGRRPALAYGEHPPEGPARRRSRRCPGRDLVLPDLRVGGRVPDRR